MRQGGREKERGETGLSMPGDMPDKVGRTDEGAIQICTRHAPAWLVARLVKGVMSRPSRLLPVVGIETRFLLSWGAPRARTHGPRVVRGAGPLPCVLGSIPHVWRARQVLLESMNQFPHPKPQDEFKTR